MAVPPLPTILFEPLVRAALAEDLGRAGDITTDAIVPPGARLEAALAARQPGIVAGLDLAALAFRLIDPSIALTVERGDGSRVGPGDVIALIAGPARGVLTAERVALNFLCHLSGVASATAAIVDSVRGHRARITCTRKTMPGLRTLQKYAVRVGGGANHRFGLDDAVLLDNMSPDELRRAVAMVDGRAVTEASVRITPATAPAIAATGVDLISVGWLTHSAAVLDIGLDHRR